MDLFDVVDYRQIVRVRLKFLGSQSGKSHRGHYSRIAEHLNIHTSMVSQIFNGLKDLTFDQACGLVSFLGLTDLEADYFICLVQLARAGTSSAKEKCQRDLVRLREQAASLSARVRSDRTLSEEDNAHFYSYWFITAIKLMTSIAGHQTPDEIARRLSLPLSVVHSALEFLLETGLCVNTGGMIRPGPAATHLPSSSPLVGRHHQNWRIKGFERMGQLLPSEFFLTIPATLTERDALRIRKALLELSEAVVTIMDDSKSEELYCLNIDWFNVAPKVNGTT
jgi:uncharacterized protein (TIGR02147 family)